jgi:ring-1,2-phenylacetyl-CoA epoxidase subunit PaaE
MKTYSLKILELRHETEETITICFKQPGLRKIRYKAGQYISLIFRINGRRYIRPYSFSSCPGYDEHLEVTIKRVFQGIVSNHIHDNLKVGDVIEVMEPMGEFVFDESNIFCKEVYLWGVGSGITPLISIAKDILSNYSNINVNLIYGNRNEDNTIFHNLIKTLNQTFSNRFKVWHFYTNFSISESSPYKVEGRISVKDVQNIMLTANTLSTTYHYICGPSGLKESVKNTLLELKVPDHQIKSEDFELIKNPQDFKDILTQIVKLKFENVDYTLEVVKGKTILESALDSGIELPYSCQTGDCSTCKGNLLGGQARMIGLKSKRADLKENEFLLCCSHPVTNNTYIEV